MDPCRPNDNKRAVDAVSADDRHPQQANLFELPIGYYTRSMYTFRLGYGTGVRE